MITRRRALFLLAVRDYPDGQPAFTAGTDAQIEAVRAFWTAPELGDRALAEQRLGVIKTRRDVENAVYDSGLRDLSAEDVAVVYVSGHGGRGASLRHYLMLPDTARDRLVSHGYPTADLIGAVLGSEARHVLVIVNSCFAGKLKAELAALELDLPARRRSLRSLAVFATADFDEMPRVREFSDLLTEVRTWLCTKAGYTEPWLSIDDFARELDQAHHRLGVIEPRHIWRTGPSEDPSPCLPNPAYQPPVPIVAESRKQVASSAGELDYWLDRASGRVVPTDPGWYFAGRRFLTAQLAAFLRTGTGLLLVTGGAGTGKSAIVARAVTLSDTGFRSDPRYAAAVAAAPTDTLPPPGSIDIAVLARNKPAELIAEQLLQALGHPPPDGSPRTMTELRPQLERQIRERNGCTIVLDGLDEATDPTLVIIDLIGPLLRLDGLVRLIIGIRSTTPEPADLGETTRRHELLYELQRFGESMPVTELRTDDVGTADDITDYLTALLSDRYSGEESERDTLARLIATSVAPSFLDARFAGQRLRDTTTLVRALDPDLSRSLNDGTIGLLRHDLTDTATAIYSPQVLLAVLRATAFAGGAGVPWADIWPTIGAAILNRDLPEGSVEHVLRGRLAGYLARDAEDGRLVYRPVHETLAETLRTQPHRLIGATDVA